jgi:hypothetical protein
MRGDEVAIHRDDQRIGAGWMLIEELLDPLADMSTLHVVPL